MAEPRMPLLSNQRLVMIISALVVVIAIVLFFSFRGCAPAGSKMTVIYSNLDLADAAKVVARLKELKIKYEIKDKGTAVAVPKDMAAKARLGLAEKNLPSGGVVGWEIFNETRMGATDFDRRIQLIRAISGELSRTIRRIEGVADARVQIVLPETRLFDVSKAPVTASVLLKIMPGSRIKGAQIRGIIHLVASSVENLKPENVMVVDDAGNILSTKAAPPLPRLPRAVLTAEAVTPTTVLTKPVTKEAKPKALSEEEKSLLKLKAKEEYERQLTASCQQILNKFFPPNSVIARVSIELGHPTKALKNYTRLKIRNNSNVLTTQVKKITIIVLVDKRMTLTSDMKKNIYQTLSLAVPYNRKRGDRIAIKKVPFHRAIPSPEDIKKEFGKAIAPIVKKNGDGKKPNYFAWVVGIGALVLVVLLIIMVRSRKKKELPYVEEQQPLPSVPPTAEEAGDAVVQIKEMAERDPEKVANLLKQWLTEET